MRLLAGLAAFVLTPMLGVAPALAATVFYEDFQDDLSRAWGNRPFESVPIETAVTVAGTSETYTEPTTGFSGQVIFRPQDSSQTLQLARRNFCLSGCAQFSVFSNYTLRSFAGNTPVLLTGQDYRLSVSLRAINSVSPITPTTRLSLFALQGGSVRASSAFDLFNDGTFSTYSLDIDGTSLGTTFTEFGFGFSPMAGSAGLFIDEILLESVPAATVPLPATGALLLFGAGALAATRRRKAS